MNMKHDEEMDVRFPDVTVTLIEDGNAFLLIGRVTQALREARATKEQIEEFRHEALGGDYDHLLRVVMSWVEVE